MTEKAFQTPIKMLVIDIDGTLLNPEGEISPSTLAAVQAAQRAGMIVTLATARRYSNTRDIATQLGLDIALILYDGALIVQHPQGITLHKETLNADIAQDAVDILVRHGIQPVVQPDSGLYEKIWTGPAEFDNLWVEAYFLTFPDMMHRRPHAQLCRGQADPLRVVAFASEEAIQGLIPEIAALDCSWTSIKRGNYGSAELVVMRAGCSKASGVAALAKYYSLALSEIMALGDNNNDIQMLQSVGLGIAMGQAPPAVKAAARFVTASNLEDGAARAIERYALGDGLTATPGFLGASSADSNSLNRATCL